MRNLLVGTAAALALVAAPRLAHAQTPTPRAELHAMFAQLGLSDDQKSQLKALHEKLAEQEHTLRAAVRTAEIQFAAALPSETNDDALRSLHEQIAKSREALMAYRFDGMLSVRKILTAEQRKKFGDLYLENHGKHGHDSEE